MTKKTRRRSSDEFKTEDNLSHWVRQLAERKHANVAVIALANKTARIAWAITRRDAAYDPALAAYAA